MPVAGHELQRADRHLLLVRGLPCARRTHRPPPRRLGDRLLRGPRRARLPRSGAERAFAGGGAGESLPDPLAQRHRPHPQGHPGRHPAREHPPLPARAVGALLDLRPQRQPEGLRARRSPGASCRSAAPTRSSPSATSSTRWLRAFRRASPRRRSCTRRCASSRARSAAAANSTSCSRTATGCSRTARRGCATSSGARPSPRPTSPTRTSRWISAASPVRRTASR